ncbi:uncharacterized protein LOC126894827 [Daktulosphaira vitifoliae]|uniref:uncharacterized protein LOC126894827 n=1 Tax=Daktulosphaira vitifoliae TaxID=58002 RepID=UPI0021AAE728|nr:uncharacterized protein LOC126894827 [Daktulosphaira vitifoliae]
MADLDSVLINLRSCLMSVKEGVPLNQIDSDYFKVIGERIPFKKLGFPSIEALIQSSDNFYIQSRGGVSVVHAVANEKTQHLNELIQRQKSKPPKKNKLFNKSFQPRVDGFSNTQNRGYNYPRNGNNTNQRPPKYYQGFISSQYNNNFRTAQTLIAKNGQSNNNHPKPYEKNGFSKPHLNNYTTNHQGNYNSNKITQNIISSTKSVLPNTDIKINKKFEVIPPLTSSCSSLESAYSSGSLGNPITSATQTMATLTRRQYKSKLCVNRTESKTGNMYNTKIKEKSSLSSLPFIPVVKPSTAQSRLQKYPKKCDETEIKDINKEVLQPVKESNAVLPENVSSSGEFYDVEMFKNTDYVTELESYIKKAKLSDPFYDCMIKKEKFGKGIKLIHICTINVNGGAVGSSFPIECNSVELAKNVAAKSALSTLKIQYGESIDYPVTEDINEMASRVKHLLKINSHESGLMSDVLEQMYRETYKQNMLDNWIQYLDVFNYFTFDKLVANKTIIYLNEHNNINQNGEVNEINGTSDVSVDNIDIDSPLTVVTINNYDEKSVLVTAIYSSIGVSIRFVGSNVDESYIKMQAKFNDTMNTSFHLVEEVVEGEYYAVLFESLWHRVQVTSLIEEDSSVTCYMIDTGDSLTVSKDQICLLDPVFKKIKAQAVQCALTQLENFSTFIGLKEILDEMLLNKSFILIPDNLEDDPNLPTVTLYEKKGNEFTNVNELIITKFLTKTVTKLPSFEENAIVDGTVSAVTISGYIYLQLNTDIVASLEEILPTECEEYLDTEYFLKSKDEIQKDKIYLAKYEPDSWSRVQVLNVLNDSEVDVIYVDYGNNGKSEITKLVDLEKFDPLMTKIPAQASKVTMNLLPPSTMTPEIATKIYEMVGNEKVLVNLINAPADDVPCIQLYKIQPETDIPVCLNIKLAQSIKKQ